MFRSRFSLSLREIKPWHETFQKRLTSLFKIDDASDPASPSGFLFFVLGLCSGLPCFFLFSTFPIHILEAGYSYKDLGFCALATFPYMGKVLLVPLIQICRFSLGIVSGTAMWIFLGQLFIAFAFLGLSVSSFSSLYGPALIATLMALGGALHDLTADIYRIEKTPPTGQGRAASYSQIGFRLGGLIAGAFALYGSSFFSWSAVERLLALFMLGLTGLTLTLLPQEIKKRKTRRRKHRTIRRQLCVFIRHLQRALAQKHFSRMLLGILGLILLYKGGDACLQTLTTPFLLSVPYTKTEIAQVVKGMGVAMLIAGSWFAGQSIDRWGLKSIFRLYTLGHGLSCLMLAMQAVIDASRPFFIALTSLEHFMLGMGTTCLATLIACSTHRPYTAAHYAILASFSSFARLFFSSFSSLTAHYIPWEWLFLFIGLLNIPLFLFLKICARNPFIKK